MTSPTVARPVSGRRSRLDAWIPHLTLATAALHLLLGVVNALPQWRGIIGDGVWDSVPPQDDSRSSALWFMVSGVGLAGMGLLARRLVRTTGRIPPELGWLLLAGGVPVAVMQPASGGWLLIGLGVVAILNATRSAEGVSS
ncbi:DUF6463 family protein [Ruania alba]|uniref:Uncharacterized protein n=1 Tax=Ruania alba TaxID=648782 RepID=A0A1H5KPL5_9MICO|nr:DUF6463 family protein [Ruania alba]SEE66574.1 hypothetical protein SAMN04488554_2372 [Ruania alba]